MIPCVRTMGGFAQERPPSVTADRPALPAELRRNPLLRPHR